MKIKGREGGVQTAKNYRGTKRFVGRGKLLVALHLVINLKCISTKTAKRCMKAFALKPLFKQPCNTAQVNNKLYFSPAIHSTGLELKADKKCQ